MLKSRTARVIRCGVPVTTASFVCQDTDVNPVDRILTPGSMPKRYTNWQVSLIVFLIALSAVIRLADLYRPAARSVDEAMYTCQAPVVSKLVLFKAAVTFAHSLP